MEGRARERRRVGALLNALGDRELGCGHGLWAAFPPRDWMTFEWGQVLMQLKSHQDLMGFVVPPTKITKRWKDIPPPGRYYHIEGTDKKDPAAPSVGSSDLDRQGFDAKRALAGG